MAGRRPRSGRESARSGPAPDTRWAWSGTTRPPGDPGKHGGPDAPAVPGASAPLGAPGASGLGGRPGDPAGQDIPDRADILERAPGRWSSFRLSSPPRWLLTLVVVLVLAGGVTAFVAGGMRHDQARPGGSHARVAVLPTACIYLIGPIGLTAPGKGRHEPRQDGGCARPGPGQAGLGGIRPGSSSICVAMPSQARHPETQFGIRQRCHPGLA